MTKEQDNKTGYEDKTVEELFEIVLECDRRYKKAGKIYNVGFEMVRGLFNRKAFEEEFRTLVITHADSLAELGNRVGLKARQTQSPASFAMDIATHDAYKDMDQAKQVLINTKQMYSQIIYKVQYMVGPKRLKQVMKRDKRRAKALVQKLS